MEISNPHNLTAPRPELPQCRFGIRVSLPKGDPLRAVLGNDWRKEQWFATAAARDAALLDMGMRHPFSRNSDTPRIVLEAIER
jgi:hypothetical protein